MTEPNLHCNFCGKDQEFVKVLIAGSPIVVRHKDVNCLGCGSEIEVPEVHTQKVCICDECVVICNEILAERKAEEEKEKDGKSE